MRQPVSTARVSRARVSVTSSIRESAIRNAVRATVEPLENRRMFSVYTVNSTSDIITADSALTFREAISLVNGTLSYSNLSTAEKAQVNTSVAADTINFNIAGSGLHQIFAKSLPSIKNPVTINGYSQPGSSAATASKAATILIELNGTFASQSNGLDIGGHNSTVRGLSITHFDGAAIEVLGGASNSVIAGNWLGVSRSPSNLSTYVTGGNGYGIEALSAYSETIGGATPADRNVISANTNAGVLLDSSDFVIVEGNYIGVDPTGTVDLNWGNGTGVEIDNGTTGSSIGYNGSGAGNVISGNNGDGIYIHGAGVINTNIYGNYIGTNASGKGALGNGANGVAVAGNGSSDNQVVNIGGPGINQRNIISGNHGSGIDIENAGNGVNVTNNYIGTSADGKSAVGNDQNGIFVDNARPFIGTTTSTGPGNVISGNGTTGDSSDPYLSSGITVEGASNNFSIYGNFIGTNAAGTAAIGNLGDGIFATGGNNLVIGEFQTYERNIISGNGRDGVELDTESNTSIINDYIGVLADGAKAAGNKRDGVQIYGVSTFNGVGGGNLGCIIANNTNDGIEIESTSEGTPTRNTFSQNSIYNNGALGIDLDSANFATNVYNSGVTLNDAGDGDTGPNDYQNFPVLTSATYSSSAITVAGSLNSKANTAFTIELFGSDKADITGYGEGKQYLGSVSVTTNASGNVGFNTTLNVAIGSNVYISGTATIENGIYETSEFGEDLKATQGVSGTAPAVPGNLVAVANSGTQVTLTWADNSSNETGFEVQRSTSSSFTSPTTFTVAANTTTYVDKTTTKSTAYYYRVRAVNSIGDSAYATAAKITTPSTTSTGTVLATPTTLAGTAVAGPAVTLTWKDNASGETGYEIEVSTSSSFSTLLKDVTVATPNLATYKVTGLTKSTYYYFRVRAVSSTTPTLDSAWSSSVKIKTLSA